MSAKKQRSRKSNRRAQVSPRRQGWCILFIFWAFIALLSLYSFDPAEVAANQSPPEPSGNYCGAIGVWLAFRMLMIFGIGAFVIAGVVMALSIFTIGSTRPRIWPQWIAGLALAVSSTFLLHMQPWFFNSLLDKFNLQGIGKGGLLSRIALEKFLDTTLGTVGSVAMLLLLLSGSLLILVQISPAQVVQSLQTTFYYLTVPPARFLRYLARALGRGAQSAATHLSERWATLPALEGNSSSDFPEGDRYAPAPRAGGLGYRPIPRDYGVPGNPAVAAPAQTRPAGDRPIQRKRVQPGRPSPAQRAAASNTPAPPTPAPPPNPQLNPDLSLEAAFGLAPPPPPQEPKPRIVRPTTPTPSSAWDQDGPAPTPSANPKRSLVPDVELLLKPEKTTTPESDQELQARGAILIHTLREFSIQAQIDRIERGPVITRFEVRPAPGVKVERIAALSNNIALNLQAPHVRILAPIPGRAAVGIEVPNLNIEAVRLRDLMESLAWKKRKARLPLAIGKDVAGRPITADLAEMPHLLIAGATGAGKTVCVNSLIVGLLFALGPDRVRFLMVDPKIVEMQIYNRLPHMIAPVITDPQKVVNGLAWAIREMERRYHLLAEVSQRHIVGYNGVDSAKRAMANERLKRKHIDQGLDEEDFQPLPDLLPYIVIIIDELADLMLAAQADIENQIARLAQLSRAVGIHLIIATQRPSVNVITGTIKANFPARIAFQVASKVDSRTILDGNGAETLLGKGDMLFLPPGKSKPIRVQGTLVEDEEIEAVVEYLEQLSENLPDFPDCAPIDLNAHDQGSTGGTNEEIEDWDPLLEDAYNIIAEADRASTSYLQRRLRIGYNRAARIMEQLEQLSIVGPANGSGPREILVDVATFRFRKP